MAIPSGSGTEVIKTSHFGSLTDLGSTPINLVTTTTTAIDTILSIMFCNSHATAGCAVNLYFDPTSGSNVYILLRQDVPGGGTFVFSDRIVLPQVAGILKASAESNVSTQNVLCSYIHQDWSS